MTLVDLEKMIAECPHVGEPKEFRGSSVAIREMARLLSTADQIAKLNEVYGFPVVVDERCEPGMVYFGRTKDFEFFANHNRVIAKP